MNDVAQFTNRCVCGWEVSGSEDVVVDATIEHGRRIHNMEATREQVIDVLRAGGPAAPAAVTPALAAAEATDEAADEAIAG
jgi:predicted small metal-binding protein